MLQEKMEIIDIIIRLYKILLQLLTLSPGSPEEPGGPDVPGGPGRPYSDIRKMS